MTPKKSSVLFRILLTLTGLTFSAVPVLDGRANSPRSVEPKNSWRGIVPLQSSTADIERVLGVEPDSADAHSSGPHRVDGGEVTFYYLTPSLAKIYRAPRNLSGKVFTIYFKPSEPASKESLRIPSGFRRCVEQMSTAHYYLISDAGVAYQFWRQSDQLETIIYQPSRAQVRGLAVNTECVF
jgi:hypothetical protein